MRALLIEGIFQGLNKFMQLFFKHLTYKKEIPKASLQNVFNIKEKIIEKKSQKKEKSESVKKCAEF